MLHYLQQDVCDYGYTSWDHLAMSTALRESYDYGYQTVKACSTVTHCLMTILRSVTTLTHGLVPEISPMSVTVRCIHITVISVVQTVSSLLTQS